MADEKRVYESFDRCLSLLLDIRECALQYASELCDKGVWWSVCQLRPVYLCVCVDVCVCVCCMVECVSAST